MIAFSSSGIIGGVGSSDKVTFETLADTNFFALRPFNEAKDSTRLSKSATDAGTLDDAITSYFTAGYAIGRTLVTGLEACGAGCTSATLPAAIESAGTVDLGDAGFGPLEFSATKHIGLTAAQFFGWDEATGAPVAKFSPVDTGALVTRSRRTSLRRDGARRRPRSASTGLVRHAGRSSTHLLTHSRLVP